MTPTEETASTDPLVSILAAHAEVGGLVTADGEWIKYVCECGASGDDDYRWHRAHLVAALRAAGWVHRDEVVASTDEAQAARRPRCGKPVKGHSVGTCFNIVSSWGDSCYRHHTEDDAPPEVERDEGVER
jgi:hypothetical protein